MIKIKQKKTVDCGLACICAIAHKPYTKNFEEKMKKIIGGGLRTYENHIRGGFKILNYNLKHNFRKLRNWNAIRNNHNLSEALVGINYNKTKDTWHWVIYKKIDGNDQYWDPYLKKNRKDFRKDIKFRSYLKIL